MQIRFTTQQLVDWGANKLLEGVSDARKDEILPVTKYNLLANVFNASTVLLVIAAASAVLFAYTMAFTLGAIGLFVRYASEKAIDKYMLPVQAQDLGRGLRHALHQATTAEKIANIFEHVALPQQRDWEPDQVVFDELALWKEKIDVPPALAADQPAGGPPLARWAPIHQNLDGDAHEPVDGQVDGNDND
jgi:hypothetical protein